MKLSYNLGEASMSYILQSSLHDWKRFSEADYGDSEIDSMKSSISMYQWKTATNRSLTSGTTWGKIFFPIHSTSGGRACQQTAAIQGMSQRAGRVHTHKLYTLHQCVSPCLNSLSKHFAQVYTKTKCVTQPSYILSSHSYKLSERVERMVRVKVLY